MTSTGTVAQAGNALRIDRADLFELMADNMPLLQGIFSGLLHAAPAAAAHARHARAGRPRRADERQRGSRTVEAWSPRPACS